MNKCIKSQDVRNIFYRMYNILKISIKEISKNINVSISTLYRWIKENPIKPINPTRTKGYNNKIKNNIKQHILEYVNNNNTNTLFDINKHIKNIYNIDINISTVYRFLKNENITYKKGTKSYIESDINKCNIFLEEIKTKTNVLVLDEAGFFMNHNKSYARSYKGSRAIIKTKGNRGNKYSLILCISKNKVEKWSLCEKSIDSNKFIDFINDLPSNNTLVLDNCAIHRSKKLNNNNKSIINISKEKNINFFYLPPYSPNLNPVEYCFNIIRISINSIRPSNFTDLYNSIEKSVISLNNKCNAIINKIWN